MKIWPFNRRTKNNDTNGSSDSFVQSTTRKTSFGSILSSFIVAFVILVAGGTGIGISAWKQTLGSEFSKSYNIRFELEPHNEQDYNFDQPLGLGTETYSELAKDAANAYSKYLNEKGVNDINVYPEWIPDSSNPNNEYAGRIFINAIVPNDYYYNKVDEKRIEIPKQNIYMNYMNSSRLTAIIQKDNNSEHKIAVIPLNQYIDNTHPASINGKLPTEVDIKLNTSFEDIVDGCFDDTPATGTNEDSTNNSQIYIVQNYYELLNYLTFVLQAEAGYKSGNTTFTEIYRYFGNTDNGESKFYDDYSSDHSFSKPENAKLGNSQLSEYGSVYYNVDNNADKLEIQESSVNNSSTWNTTNDAPLYFESKKDDNNQWSPTGNINYNFLNKWILAFGQPDKKAAQSGEEVANSFLKIIPNKNPTNTKEDSNWQWLTINASDRYQARNIVNGIKNYNFPLPIKPITLNGYQENNTNSIFGSIDNNTNEIKQSFANTLLGYSPVVGLIISLCLIILGIGIIVSILYRIPGLFGTITILGSFGLTLMILILSNYVVSLGLFLGLLVGVLGSSLAIFSWCSRIKKLHRSGLLFDVAVRKGIKHGFLPTIDIHMIMLLLGICVSYFGTNQIDPFGNALLIFSIVSFAITGLIWMLLTLLLFNNRIGSKKTKWFFKPKHEKNIPIVTTKNYETIYSGKFETKRFTLFGWRQIVCASLVGFIVLLGVILILTIGVHSAYSFYGGSRLVMSDFTYASHSADFIGYSNLVRSDGLVYLYYDHTFNLGNLSWVIRQELPDKPWQNDFVSLQSISSTGILDYTRSTIYMLLITSGLVALYSFIRLNWVSVIAVFLGLLATPLLTIGIVAICQIYFDVYIMIAITIVYALNAFLVIHLVSILNNYWIRKQIFTTQDLRKIFNAEFKNSFIFFAWCYGILVGTFLIMLLVNTVSIIWFIIIIIIGIFASIPTIYAVVPICLYAFIRLRYRYLTSNNFENPLLRKNYDAIDEQLIDGINQFKRKIPVL
ncbi:MAG: hypothetical protein LBF36_00210 [Mycoplasmataceae bacterium]|nr:hypothetical protein [Mycoplasmataceae bacterium]